MRGNMTGELKNFLCLLMANTYPPVLRRRLKRMLGDKNAKIVCGPWMSEIGYELLYWIPFLRWVKEEYGIESERMHVISRGGVAGWYHGLAGGYSDLFDGHTVDVYNKESKYRMGAWRTQKQVGISPFERRFVDSVVQSERLGNHVFLHPSLMYNFMKYFPSGFMPVETIAGFSRYSALPVNKRPAFLAGLSENYVVVKFYANDTFPNTPENKIFIRRLLERLCEKYKVVTLDTGMAVDDHMDMGCSEFKDRLYRIDHLFKEKNNLGIQTEVIKHATAFFGTYGGYAHIPLFYKVKSFGFFSKVYKYFYVHRDLTNRVADALGHYEYKAIDINKIHVDSFLRDI